MSIHLSMKFSDKVYTRMYWVHACKYFYSWFFVLNERAHTCTYSYIWAHTMCNCFVPACARPAQTRLHPAGLLEFVSSALPARPLHPPARRRSRPLQPARLLRCCRSHQQFTMMKPWFQVLRRRWSRGSPWTCAWSSSPHWDLLHPPCREYSCSNPRGTWPIRCETPRVRLSQVLGISFVRFEVSALRGTRSYWLWQCRWWGCGYSLPSWK